MATSPRFLRKAQAVPAVAPPTPETPPEFLPKDLLDRLTRSLQYVGSEQGRPVKRSNHLDEYLLETRRDQYGRTLFRLFRARVMAKLRLVAEWRPRPMTDGIFYAGIAPHKAGDLRQSLAEELGCPPEAVKLYGSRIRGYFTETSDLDVAVLDPARSATQEVLTLEHRGFRCEVRFTSTFETPFLQDAA